MEDSEVNVSFGNDGSNLAEVRGDVFASHYLVLPEFLKSVPVAKGGWTETDLKVCGAGRLTVSAQMLRIAVKGVWTDHESTIRRIEGHSNCSRPED